MTKRRVPSSIGPYKFIRTLGQGSFSIVKLVLNVQNDYYYACKIIPRDKIKQSAIFYSFEREVRINQQIHHAGHVEFLDMMSDENSFYIIMQLCIGGSLLNYLINHGKLSEDEAKPLFRQIIETVHYVHEFHKVSHRDLKPDNILFNDRNKLQIADFGLATYVSKISKNNLVYTPCGSISYASPECLSGKPYDGFATDVWSAGVILYEMLEAHSPWKNSNKNSVLMQIRSGEYTIPENFSDSCKDLLKRMLDLNPKTRISTRKILKHRWLRGTSQQFHPSDNVYGAVSLKLIDAFFDKEPDWSSVHQLKIPKLSFSFKHKKIEKMENILKKKFTTRKSSNNNLNNLNSTMNSNTNNNLNNKLNSTFHTELNTRYSSKGSIANLNQNHNLNPKPSIRLSNCAPSLTNVKCVPPNPKDFVTVHPPFKVQPPSHMISGLHVRSARIKKVHNYRSMQLPPMEELKIIEPPPLPTNANGHIPKKGVNIRLRRKRKRLSMPA